MSPRDVHTRSAIHAAAAGAVFDSVVPQRTRRVDMPEGHKLTVANGFNVNVFADKLQQPRFMALSPNGDVFITEPSGGKVTVLRDADKNGVAETKETFASGLTRPFGIAFWKDYLYIGNNDAVVRFAYKAGQITAAGSFEKLADLPPSNAGVIAIPPSA